MDYQNKYDTVFNATFSKKEAFFKEQLILAKNQNQTFNYTSNTLLKTAFEDIKSNFKHFNEEPLTAIVKLFNNRFSMYEENQITNIIEYKIKPFISQLENNSSIDLNELICDLATHDALKEASRIFNNNYNLDQLMYTLNDFRKFELKMYKGSLENYPIYKKLRAKVYPEKKSKNTTINKAIENEDEFLTINEVSILTNYAVPTIYDLKHKRKIPFYKNGAKLQFKKAEILDWMQKGKGITKEDLEAKANEYILKNS